MCDPVCWGSPETSKETVGYAPLDQQIVPIRLGSVAGTADAASPCIRRRRRQAAITHGRRRRGRVSGIMARDIALRYRARRLLLPRLAQLPKLAERVARSLARRRQFIHHRLPVAVTSLLGSPLKARVRRGATLAYASLRVVEGMNRRRLPRVRERK